jgi:NAD(P)-dependent dehydrogenase (short-subunit alcohol dehydrogenase family)
MHNTIHNTAIVITGGAQRIGKAIAIACARHGFSVIIHYNRSQASAEKLCEELAAENCIATSLQADLSQKDIYNGFIEQAMNISNGTLVGLVNNASIFPADTFTEMTYSSMAEAMTVNAWAPLELSRAFAKQVKSGAIVNILDSRLPGFDFTHCSYSLSKHMFQAITMLCASEFAPIIRVNGVAPGLILPPAGKTNSYVEKLIGRVPLHKKGTTDDVAQTVVFLLKSQYITGAILNVDGGRNALGTLNSPLEH